MRQVVCVAFLLFLVVACGSAPQAPQDRTAASPIDAAWQPFQLPAKRPTRYVSTVVGDRPVIEAEADNAVSLYRRRVRVEPSDLGSLAFSWMVPSPPANIASAGPTVESYESPVRLLLSFDGDHARISMKDRLLFDLLEAFSGELPPYATLMYVWDPRAPRESVIPTATTGRVRKIVVDSGPVQPAVWRFHERDIASDFKKAFGEAPGPLTSVALMTGSDSGVVTARAYYGEVKLLSPSGAAQ